MYLIEVGSETQLGSQLNDLEGHFGKEGFDEHFGNLIREHFPSFYELL